MVVGEREAEGGLRTGMTRHRGQVGNLLMRHREAPAQTGPALGLGRESEAPQDDLGVHGVEGEPSSTTELLSSRPPDFLPLVSDVNPEILGGAPGLPISAQGTPLCSPSLRAGHGHTGGARSACGSHDGRGPRPARARNPRPPGSAAPSAAAPGWGPRRGRLFLEYLKEKGEKKEKRMEARSNLPAARRKPLCPALPQKVGARLGVGRGLQGDPGAAPLGDAGPGGGAAG